MLQLLKKTKTRRTLPPTKIIETEETETDVVVVITDQEVITAMDIVEVAIAEEAVTIEDQERMMMASLRRPVKRKSAKEVETEEDTVGATAVVRDVTTVVTAATEVTETAHVEVHAPRMRAQHSPPRSQWSKQLSQQPSNNSELGKERLSFDLMKVTN